MEVTVVVPDSVIEAVAERAAELVLSESSRSDEAFISTSEAAEYLSVSRQRIYQLASLGRIPSRKIGASRRFLRSELFEWVEHGGDVCP